MPEWFENLPTLADDDLPDPFHDGVSASRRSGVALSSEKRHQRRVHQRSQLNLLRVANAAKALGGLPGPGESCHVIMAGNFDAFDVTPAVLRLANPATIVELNIATLGFNTRNTNALVDLLDAGQVGRCTFICSLYFKSMQDGGQIYQHIYQELTSRGHPCCAIRCHAKIILFELSDGTCLTVESSANLRSCRNIEQMVISNDRPLLEFHRGWMREVLASGS